MFERLRYYMLHDGIGECCITTWFFSTAFCGSVVKITLVCLVGFNQHHFDGGSVDVLHGELIRCTFFHHWLFYLSFKWVSWVWSLTDCLFFKFRHRFSRLDFQLIIAVFLLWIGILLWFVLHTRLVHFATTCHDMFQLWLLFGVGAHFQL